MSRDVDVEFIGVWDTVSSVGALIPRVLPFSLQNKTRVFRHALALDEHRARFRANTYHYTQPKVFTLVGLVGESLRGAVECIRGIFGRGRRMGDEEVSSETVNTLRREGLSDVDAKEVDSQCFLSYFLSSTLKELTLS